MISRAGLFAAFIALGGCATPGEEGVVLKDPAGPRRAETSFRFACEKAEIKASHSFDATKDGAPVRHTLSVIVNGRPVGGAQAVMDKIASELVDEMDAISISVVRCPDSSSGDGLGLAARDGGTEWLLEVAGGVLKLKE
ncbi:MAG TPA: hypothetical protein VGO52_19175 [Hyphomonadaceae bacterium]|jgi:hypothetical protein|nr:hypothetical protein [Hyphomonadaceae bacterium]